MLKKNALKIENRQVLLQLIILKLLVLQNNLYESISPYN